MRKKKAEMAMKIVEINIEEDKKEVNKIDENRKYKDWKEKKYKVVDIDYYEKGKNKGEDEEGEEGEAVVISKGKKKKEKKMGNTQGNGEVIQLDWVDDDQFMMFNDV